MALAPPKTALPSGPNTSASRPRYTDRYLTPNDKFWLRNEDPLSPGIIHFCVHLDKDVSLNELSDRIKVWTDTYIRFQSVVVNKGWNRMEWSRIPNFDPIALKVCLEHTLPSATDASLFEFIDSCVNQPLFPKNTVLWRMYKANNVPWGGCICVWRVHHCVCDGVSLVTAMQKFFGEKSPDESRPLSPAYVPAKGTPTSPFSPTYYKASTVRPTFEKATLAVTAAGVTATLGAQLGIGQDNPWMMWALGMTGAMIPSAVRFAYNNGPRILQASMEMLALRIPDSRTSLKGPLSEKKHTAVMGDLITAEQMRQVTTAVTARMGDKYTVNDVLCGMLSGAFRRYFLLTGRNPDKTKLSMCVPMNMRKAWDTINIENRFSTVFVRLAVHKRTIPERMSAIHASMTDLKGSLVPRAMEFMLKVVDWLPQPLFKLLIAINCMGGSMGVSNVNGNATPLRLVNAKVTEVYAWIPGGGDVSVGISLFTYNNKVNFGLIADKNHIPDLGQFKQCLREEWRAVMDEFQ